MSLYNKTLPHWSGPSYYALILIGAYVFHHEFLVGKYKTLKRGMIFGQVIFATVMILLIFQLKTNLLDFNGGKKTEDLGKNDFSIELGLWENISSELKLKLQEDFEKRSMPKKAPIITHNWFPASHLDYY
ncbi:hypothetical protein, partial [Xanthovirga aplysinae]|uniref:hypothetical protein n=1 Tax=Xanthovirga aplysinae TaxID=2529853 RepID=UPI0012BD22A9